MLPILLYWRYSLRTSFCVPVVGLASPCYTHLVSPMQPLPQTQAVVNSVSDIVVILPLFVSIQTVSLCKIVKQIVGDTHQTTQQMTITIKLSAIHTIYFVDIDAHAHERSFIYKSKLHSTFARRN